GSRRTSCLSRSVRASWRTSLSWLELQQRLEVTPEDLVLLVLRQALQALHPRHGRGVPRHERPVAPEHHAVDADLVDQEAQRLLAADDGVVVEPALVRAGRLRDTAALSRHALPAAVETPHRQARGPAAVGDARLELGALVEDAEDQYRDDDRVVEDDAQAVEEPVLGRALHQ